MKYRIAAFDPGVTNFACSILEVDRGVVTLLHSCQLTASFKSINPATMRAYKQEIYHILAGWEPRYVVAERFMYRRNRRSAAHLIEPINMMLGIMEQVSTQLGILSYFPHAAQWKKWRNAQKDWDGEKWLEPVKDLMVNFENPTDHMVDSTTIGHWFHEAGCWGSLLNTDLRKTHPLVGYRWAEVQSPEEPFVEMAGDWGESVPFVRARVAPYLENKRLKLEESLLELGTHFRSRGPVGPYGHLRSRLVDWRGNLTWILPQAVDWSHLPGTVISTG